MRTDGTIDMSPFKNGKQDSPSINEVSFVRVEATKTLTRLYEELSEESKFFYDSLVDMSHLFASISCFITDKYFLAKLGQYRVCRITLRGGVVICECYITDPSLSEFSRSAGAGCITVQPIKVRLVNQKAFEAAQFTLKLAYESAEKCRLAHAELKRNEKNAKRRAQRLKVKSEDI